MNFITYQEKLGINFNDEKKAKRFISQIYNFVMNSSDIDFDYSVEKNFCDIIGEKLDKITMMIQFSDEVGLQRAWIYMERHTKNFKEFLSVFVELINSYPKSQKNLKLKLKSELIRSLDDCKIKYSFIEDDDGYFVFPKGVKEFDDALVSRPLEWLKDYPKSEKIWSKALREYSEATSQNASEIADKFRKTLETFFQEFFESDKSLENLKADYGKYLKNQGIPSEISNNLQSLLQTYTNYMNSYAKHHDATNINILEYLMYQTGNIMRLLMTLKQEEKPDAN